MRIPGFSYPYGGLPDHLGIEVVGYGQGWLEMRMKIEAFHMRPGASGLHAGSMVTLADSACGFGCQASLPEGALGFTTVELKSNFLRSATDGTLFCRAEGEHLDRTIQVWSAEIHHEESQKKLALFQCSQMILWPKA